MISRISTLSLIFIGSLFLTGISDCGKEKPKDVKEITIFHTNDLHSHFRAEHRYTAGNPYGLGGLARMKTLLDSLRSGRKNTVFLDAGDHAEGSPYYFVDAGANMLRIMDAMGYDAAVVGNHDFLNGPLEMAKRVERANPRFHLLGANMNLSDPQVAPHKDYIKKYVKERTIITTEQGVRVAVIGLLCVDYFYYPYFKPAIVTAAVKAASEIAKSIRQNNLADVIVLLSHNTNDLNKAWAKQVPWVNVVVSGHSHKKMVEPYITSNGGQPAYVVETGSGGHFLGELVLNVDTKNRTVKLKKYQIHPVKEDLAEDLTIKAMIMEEEEKLADKFGFDIFNDVVGHSSGRYYKGAVKPHEAVMANFAADAYRRTANADMGIETGKLLDVGISRGPLSTADIISAIPHIYHPHPGDPDGFPELGRTWTVQKLTLKGSEIGLLMNAIMRLQTVIPLGWISVSGVKITYSGKTKSVVPIKKFEIWDKESNSYVPLNDRKDYVLALTDGLMVAVEILKTRGHFPVDISRLEDTNVETWRAALDLLAEVGTIHAKDYEQGFRYRATEPDLDMYDHRVELVQNGQNKEFQVEIRNAGLKKSGTGHKLEYWGRGINHRIFDGTDKSPKVKLQSDVSIPPLEPGERIVIKIPATINKSGVHSFGFDIVDSEKEDGNPNNQRVRFHYKN